jgi:hypothetical protein
MQFSVTYTELRVKKVVNTSMQLFSGALTGWKPTGTAASFGLGTAKSKYYLKVVSIETAWLKSGISR